jgi:ABC-type antimicrobial peptide transport system permease subunit
MRAITTNWNNSAYALSATFVDKVSGNAVTVPALNPMNHRSMVDSVESGAYIYQPDELTVSDETLATAPEDEDEVTVTVNLDSVPVEFTWTSWIFLNCATLVICLSALIIPSLLITRIQPVKAIRFN